MRWNFYTGGSRWLPFVSRNQQVDPEQNIVLVTLYHRVFQVRDLRKPRTSHELVPCPTVGITNIYYVLWARHWPKYFTVTRFIRTPVLEVLLSSPVPHTTKLRHGETVPSHAGLGLNPRNLPSQSSFNSVASKDSLGQLYRRGHESSIRWGTISRGNWAGTRWHNSRFLVPRILFSVIWHVHPDLPSYLARDFPLVRAAYVVKKCLYLQKHVGSSSVVESSNYDQIPLDL